MTREKLEVYSITYTHSTNPVSPTTNYCVSTFFRSVHYEQVFKQCHQKYQGQGPTGMLFVYPEHVVHMIECSWEIMEAIIRDALKQDKSSR